MPNKRVLILEFDTLLCDLMVMVLRRYGFDAILCDDPSMIREMIKTQHPETIIMDTHLSDQNGLDLLRQLKEEKLLAQMHVIIISALGFSCIVREAVDAGADDFLVKPLDLDTLIMKLNNYQKDTPANMVSASSQIA